MTNLRLASLLLAFGACSDSTSIDSNEQARRAYLGLDTSLSKSLTLAFQGYDAASSANIPDSDGKFVVDTKNTMIEVTYDTSTDVATQPVLSLKLNGSSGNTIDGTLMGDYTMTGALSGKVTLDLPISGTFTGSGTTVARVPGTTMVTGTAINASGGMYTIDVTI